MKKAIVPIVAVIAVAAVGDLLYRSAGKSVAMTPTPVPDSQAPTASTASASAYKDGTYVSTGNYTSPDGNEAVGVSLTVAGGNITAATVTPQGPGRESTKYQQKFASGIAGIVVGKPLSSAFDVSAVSGSSLTGSGFTEALAAIRSQAS